MTRFRLPDTPEAIKAMQLALAAVAAESRGDNEGAYLLRRDLRRTIRRDHAEEGTFAALNVLASVIDKHADLELFLQRACARIQEADGSS